MNEKSKMTLLQFTENRQLINNELGRDQWKYLKVKPLSIDTAMSLNLYVTMLYFIVVLFICLVCIAYCVNTSYILDYWKCACKICIWHLCCRQKLE